MTEKKPGLTYRDAGVNIDAADESLRRVRETVRRTFDANVLRDIGSFGAMYSLGALNMQDPVLVSSVDGVGTKLKIAFMANRHDTVGVDLVSHCVNDILVQGARPLFFLDYLACGVMDPDVVEAVITGVATGCRYAGCALIGGETAEMPGMYSPDEYDLAGTIVGIVERSRIVDGSTIQEGDIIIGLRSSGLHTNGYSLARKLCFDVAGLRIDDELPGTGKSVADALLEPHKSYARLIQLVRRIITVRGMAHVTGGGLTDNLPRVLPPGVDAEIDLTSWEVSPLFKFLANTGNVEQREMLRTFNCGIGFMVIVPEPERERALDAFMQAMEDATVIGRIIPGDGKVHYRGNLRYAG